MILNTASRYVTGENFEHKETHVKLPMITRKGIMIFDDFNRSIRGQCAFSPGEIVPPAVDLTCEMIYAATIKYYT